jgi:4-alpha-glucanotransferase
MHISSLPGRYGIGDLGGVAREFAGILAEAGARAWQILPLAPTSGVYAHSPYSSPSAFAGSTLYISPDDLADDGLIDRDDLKKFEVRPSAAVDYEAAADIKKKILAVAYKNFRGDGAHTDKYRALSDEFRGFCADAAWWLEDYALFSVLKELEGGEPWSGWREAYKHRDWSVLDPLKETPEVARMLDAVRFSQFLFFRQHDALRQACRERDIALIGDLPIYVAYDSADVWGYQDLFELDGEGRPTVVAGVPPDYFSETGQRWGSPIYRWERMKQDGWLWWTRRFRHALRMADMVRVDHFRGFVGYWEIPANENTAVNGAWKPGPGREFFGALRERLAPEGGVLPFIAEDLGVLTPDVRETMEEFGLPGMKVLQFAFSDGMPHNPYVPHNHRRGCAVFIGTHDNNTALGWWNEESTEDERIRFMRYIDRPSLTERELPDAVIRMALSSTADLAVLTAQDILAMGGDARMNTPGTTEGNWQWRLIDYEALRQKAPWIKKLAVMFGRYEEPKPQESETEMAALMMNE